MLVSICNLLDGSVNPEDLKDKRKFRWRFFASKKVSRMKFAVISVCFVVWTACAVDDKGLDWGDARPYHFVCKCKTTFYGHRCERQRAHTYGWSKTAVLLTSTMKTKKNCVKIGIQNKIQIQNKMSWIRSIFLSLCWSEMQRKPS